MLNEFPRKETISVGSQIILFQNIFYFYKKNHVLIQ